MKLEGLRTDRVALESEETKIHFMERFHEKSRKEEKEDQQTTLNPKPNFLTLTVTVKSLLA